MNTIAAGSAVLGARLGGRRPAGFVRTGRSADGRVLRCEHLRRRRHRRWPTRPDRGRTAALAPCAQLHRPVAGRRGKNLRLRQRANFYKYCKFTHNITFKILYEFISNVNFLYFLILLFCFFFINF